MLSHGHWDHAGGLTRSLLGPIGNVLVKVLTLSKIVSAVRVAKGCRHGKHNISDSAQNVERFMMFTCDIA